MTQSINELKQEVAARECTLKYVFRQLPKETYENYFPIGNYSPFKCDNCMGYADACKGYYPVGKLEKEVTNGQNQRKS